MEQMVRQKRKLYPHSSPFFGRFFMRFFINLSLPVIVIGLFIAAGCSKDSGTNTPVNPVGTWKVTQSGATMTIVVNSNNTFTMDLSGVSTMSGTYTLSGNQITLTYTGCTIFGLPSTDCGDPDVGTVSGNQMTIPNNDGSTSTLTRQ
jgi:hypothetical protein